MKACDSGGEAAGGVTEGIKMWEQVLDGSSGRGCELLWRLSTIF